MSVKHGTAGQGPLKRVWLSRFGAILVGAATKPPSASAPSGRARRRHVQCDRRTCPIRGSTFAQAVDGDAATERSSRRSLTSDSWNLRCPPGVRIDPMRPDAAHLVTVFGSTRNIRATSPGVSNRSWMSIVTGYLLLGPERCHGQRLMLILRRQGGSGVRPNYAFMSDIDDGSVGPRPRATTRTLFGRAPSCPHLERRRSGALRRSQTCCTSCGASCRGRASGRS